MNELLDWILSLFKTPQKPTPNPEPEPEPEPEPKSDPYNISSLLLSAHNNERIKNNLQPLIIDNKLIIAAEKHAKWMSENKSISHTGINGSNNSDRIKAEGYLSRYSGENIAYGYDSIQSTMQGWMKSSGHRSNILSKNYTKCGFAKSGKYWCAVFASPNYNNS